jgi:hypothetical protein
VTPTASLSWLRTIKRQGLLNSQMHSSLIIVPIFLTRRSCKRSVKDWMTKILIISLSFVLIVFVLITKLDCIFIPSASNIRQCDLVGKWGTNRDLGIKNRLLCLVSTCVLEVATCSKYFYFATVNRHPRNRIHARDPILVTCEPAPDDFATVKIP